MSPHSESHILVVEDDKDLREILGEALRLEGFSVVCVEHGAAALRYLGTGARPSVILLDLMMPVMDGWTFRRELLKDEVLAQIPLVVMTAVGQGRATSIESNATLYKPLEIEAVLDAVESYLPRTGS
jgi:CheY-like chemotaxis protein